MTRFFCKARKAKQSFVGQDLLSFRTFDSFILSEKLLELASELIASPNIYYYGETNLAINSIPFTQWHRDARGTPENIEAFQEPGADGKFINAWRFAVYHADYQRHSGGLKVCPESHKFHTSVFGKYLQKNLVFREGNLSVPMTPFPLVNLDSTPRDLIVFNLYTYHSGGFIRFENVKPLLPHIESQLAKVNLPCAPEAAPRDALMIDFCGASEESDLYIKWRRNRLITEKSVFSEKQNVANIYSYFEQDLLGKAKSVGVKLRFDRCIAECLWNLKHGIQSSISVDELLAMNEEFSVISDNASWASKVIEEFSASRAKSH